MHMNHIQVSIKFNEDLYNEIAQTTSTMRMNKHAFIVSAVEETLKLIKNRGKEKLPLLAAEPSVLRMLDVSPMIWVDGR